MRKHYQTVNLDENGILLTKRQLKEHDYVCEKCWIEESRENSNMYVQTFKIWKKIGTQLNLF